MSVRTIQTDVNMRNEFENKKIKWLDFLYFNIRSFEFSKCRLFYIWSFQVLTPTPKGECSNFEQSNFKMANISNFKINERSNVERLNLRVTTIRNENWEDKASKFFQIKGQISESPKLRMVRNIEWTNNLKIC